MGWAFTATSVWFRLGLVIEVRSKSLPLILLAGAAIGVVSSLRTRESLERFDQIKIKFHTCAKLRN